MLEINRITLDKTILNNSYQKKIFVVNYSNFGQNYTEKYTFDQLKKSVKNNTSFNVEKLTKKELVFIFFELNE